MPAALSDSAGNLPPIILPSRHVNISVAPAAQRGNFGRFLNHTARTSRMSVEESSRIIRARNFECFGYREVVEIIGGQGPNRGIDAGVFRAAYRIAAVV